jgi:hypothetical protein
MYLLSTVPTQQRPSTAAPLPCHRIGGTARNDELDQSRVRCLAGSLWVAAMAISRKRLGAQPLLMKPAWPLLMPSTPFVRPQVALRCFTLFGVVELSVFAGVFLARVRFPAALLKRAAEMRPLFARRAWRVPFRDLGVGRNRSSSRRLLALNELAELRGIDCDLPMLRRYWGIWA